MHTVGSGIKARQLSSGSCALAAPLLPFYRALHKMKSYYRGGEGVAVDALRNYRAPQHCTRTGSQDTEYSKSLGGKINTTYQTVYNPENA